MARWMGMARQAMAQLARGGRGSPRPLSLASAARHASSSAARNSTQASNGLDHLKDSYVKVKGSYSYLPIDSELLLLHIAQQARELNSVLDSFYKFRWVGYACMACPIAMFSYLAQVRSNLKILEEEVNAQEKAVSVLKKECDEYVARVAAVAESK